MAFIRKKGDYYYLVMSYRDDEGKVRQKVLSYLGKEPTIDDKIIDEVEKKFPELDIDWASIEGATVSSEREKKEDETETVEADRSWIEWD